MPEWVQLHLHLIPLSTELPWVRVKLRPERNFFLFVQRFNMQLPGHMNRGHSLDFRNRGLDCPGGSYACQLGRCLNAWARVDVCTVVRWLKESYNGYIDCDKNRTFKSLVPETWGKILMWSFIGQTTIVAVCFSFCSIHVHTVGLNIGGFNLIDTNFLP